MVDENKNNPKKSNRKIKATTGAWWKSTVVEIEEESPVSAGSGNDTGEKAAASSKEAPAKPRKKRSPRSTSASSKTATDKLDSPAKAKSPDRPAAKNKARETLPDAPPPETAAAVEEAPQAVSQETDSPAEEKKRAKRSPRKRGPRSKKQVDETGSEASTGQTAQEPAEAEIAESGTDQADTVIDVSPEQKKKKRTSARKPRGRRKGTPERGEEESTETADEHAGKADVSTAEVTAEAQPEDTAAEVGKTEKADIEPEPEEPKEKVVLKLLINAEEPEECRLALLENGRLESIHVSTITRTQTKNNIYKGRIVAIEPNLQAAFVDYGTEKNGFLPFSEIHPEYYKQNLSEDIQKLVDAHHWKKLSITDVVEKGQDVMVQVVKEEVGKKGANMTTYLSLPGRSVVLMPGSDSSGISRKITGEERRSKLRDAMNAQSIPEGIGWIVRTAGSDITKTALARDVGYLLRLWEEIKKKAQDLEGVGQVYEDHQSVLRFLREHFDPDIEEILVDAQDALEQVKEFISLLPSKQRDVKVRLHKGSRPIFNQFSVEDQIESIYQPHVNLPSGGSIVIDPTEALVAIDVNSGSTSKGKNFEQSIYQANMEAASELARQLRLRDLGGLIVVDFIDMRNKKHIRDVERQLKQAMKRDKAKVDFSRISKFGLMQISRQKLGAPIEAGNYRVCRHCKGRGMVRSVETLALFYLRRIQTGASRKHIKKVECRFPMDVAQYLLNKKRHEIHDHESRYKTEISITADPEMSPVENEIVMVKAEKEHNSKKQA